VELWFVFVFGWGALCGLLRLRSCIVPAVGCMSGGKSFAQSAWVGLVSVGVGVAVNANVCVDSVLRAALLSWFHIESQGVHECHAFCSIVCCVCVWRVSYDGHCGKNVHTAYQAIDQAGLTPDSLWFWVCL
jgi:hypothetical protein